MNVVPLGVWLRRGAGPIAGLALLVFSAAVIGLQHPWVDEADWGLRYLAASAYIVAPLLAAGCANDVARKAVPTLMELSRTTRHRARLWSSMVLSLWAWSLVAAGVAATAVVSIVAVNGGVPARDPWLWAESASIFLAAVMVGLVIGQSVSGVLAPVLAAVAVFASANLLGPLGVPLFGTGVASGSLVGLERNGVNAGLGVALHLTLVIVCAAWSWWWSGPRPVRSAVAKMCVTGALLAFAGGVAAAASDPDEFVPTSERYVCVGTRPAVCGPVSAQGAMRSAQQGFASAVSQLDGRGLTLTPTVVVLRGSAVQERAAEGTPFALDPSRVNNGSIDHNDAASVLAAPRACAALFSDTDFQPVLADIDVVQRWMLAVLVEGPGTSAGGSARAPAPATVVDAYRRLSTCPLA